MDRNALLEKIQSYGFAAYDMLLYLDTHPKDKKAFEMFKQLVEKTNKLRNEYEKDFGPLTPFAAAKFNNFTWTDSPWPWEKEANS
ncbi:MAG: spore coat protein CotJB [Oscillospiraceae bacterium]|nr:spore coat protein CotJB [Oscillospiraceae bacterium]